MNQNTKAKEFWTNCMSMSTSIEQAQYAWPKAEWPDLRCYVYHSAYEETKARAEKLELYKRLTEPLIIKLHGELIAANERIEKLTEALEAYSSGPGTIAYDTLAEDNKITGCIKNN